MDYYFWIKAGHLVSVIIFISGMILNGFLFTYLRPTVANADWVTAAIRWNARFIGTVLMFVWIFGLTLAWLGGWYADVWMWVKFVLAFILAGIHGVQTSMFRKLAADPDEPVPAFLRQSGILTMVFVALIVILVSTKPF